MNVNFTVDLILRMFITKYLTNSVYKYYLPSQEKFTYFKDTYVKKIMLKIFTIQNLIPVISVSDVMITNYCLEIILNFGFSLSF